MKYRPDIDGLRALSVLAVIIFHSGFSFLSGGYVGVDIFFVISGYLITGLVFDEVDSGTFTYANFYKRRIARLLPALLITLLMVLIFGFVFYNNRVFDNLGKEVFFSAIGAANILFAQGVNYFAQGNEVRPLIHLWSLGVEEQFYLIWPTAIVVLASTQLSLKLKHILFVIMVLFFLSLYLAVTSVDDSPIKTYFYPHYRAFELLIGAFTAIWMRSKTSNKLAIGSLSCEMVTLLSLALMISPMFLLDEHSTFPGFNTLYPSIGTALFIAFASQTTLAKGLSFPVLLFIGLISYPLYLYHQPIISAIQFFGVDHNNLTTLVLVVLISTPLAWLTYIFIEKPVRRLAHNNNKSTKFYISSLVASLIMIAVAGMFIAKNKGISKRFQLLNPFAYQVTQQSSGTFHNHFKRGIQLSKTNNKKVLFVGDSVLQQYVYPFSKALNIDFDKIDTVTRGGCVLLKGVEFLDIFSDISCSDLSNKLYKLETKYELIVISQSWTSYDNKILNSKLVNQQEALSKWTPFINNSVEHFKKMSDRIIIIGSHLSIEGTSKLNPTVFLTNTNYQENLSHLKVSNIESLKKSYSFFNKWERIDKVTVIHPMDLWTENNDSFTLHDGTWAFFSDKQHASSASTAYLVNKLTDMLKKHRLKAIKPRLK